MNDLLKRPGYRLYPPDSPRGRELLAGMALPASTSNRLSSGTRRRPAQDRHHPRPQRGRHLRRCRRACPESPDGGAAALASGPRAARPRARGQHRAVPRGRHGARLIAPTPTTLRRRGDPAAAISSKQHRMRARRSELLYGRDHRRLRWPIAPIWSRWLFAWSRAATTASSAGSRWWRATPTKIPPPSSASG
jgi:hypothetical protein